MAKGTTRAAVGKFFNLLARGRHLINSSRWRGQRFGLATRREEGASPQWGCDRRTTKWPAQRSAAPVSHFALSFSPVCSLGFILNAAAGICEMASESRNFPRASQRFLTHGARMAGRIGGGSGILGATGGTACGDVGAGVSGALTSPGWLPGGGQVL